LCFNILHPLASGRSLGTSQFIGRALGGAVFGLSKNGILRRISCCGGIDAATKNASYQLPATCTASWAS
jgi:hypothetical protein